MCGREKDGVSARGTRDGRMRLLSSSTLSDSINSILTTACTSRPRCALSLLLAVFLSFSQCIHPFISHSRLSFSPICYILHTIELITLILNQFNQ